MTYLIRKRASQLVPGDLVWSYPEDQFNFEVHKESLSRVRWTIHNLYPHKHEIHEAFPHVATIQKGLGNSLNDSLYTLICWEEPPGSYQKNRTRLLDSKIRVSVLHLLK